MGEEKWKETQIFNITSQGDISGFVHTNVGTIASSYFAGGTLTNTSIGGIETTTSGFASYNSGTITGSYVKGTGENAFSLLGTGITTSSIGAGFIANNAGEISDCYAGFPRYNRRIPGSWRCSGTFSPRPFPRWRGAGLCS